MKKILFTMIMFAFAQIGKADDIVVTGNYTLCNIHTIPGASALTCDGSLNLNLQGNTLRFKLGGKLIGSGKIYNGFIEANYNQDIFDPGIVLETTGIYAMKIYNENFSACWFGASPANPDNYASFQKAITTCINLGIPLFIPPLGIYNYSQSLMIGIENGSTTFQNVTYPLYRQVSLHMFGGSQFFSTAEFTTLHYTGAGHTYALAMQQGKGIEINNMKITGMYVPPSAANDNLYYLTTVADYNDVSGAGCDFDYTGVVVDPQYYPPGLSPKPGGTTGLKMHDVCVSNFAYDFNISPGGTGNSDILIFENIQVGESKIGFLATYSQSKGNEVRGLYSVGRMHTLIVLGAARGTGFWNFEGGYVTGKCIRLADIRVIAWFPIKIKNFYCENIGSIGRLIDQGSATPNNRPPIYLQGCNFDFVFTTNQQVILLTNSDLQKFESCRFRYLNHYQDGSILYRTSTPGANYGLNNLRNPVFNCPLSFAPNPAGTNPTVFIMQ